MTSKTVRFFWPTLYLCVCSGQVKERETAEYWSVSCRWLVAIINSCSKMSLQFHQSTVPLTSFSCWMSLEVWLILVWWSLLYHVWSEDWTLTAVTHASGLSLFRLPLEAALTWALIRQSLQSSQPFLHSLSQEASATRMLRSPTFVRWCWLQRQATAATYLTLSSSLLVENRIGC